MWILTACIPVLVIMTEARKSWEVADECFSSNPSDILCKDQNMIQTEQESKEEWYFLAKPKMEEPLHLPFLPYFVGNEGLPVQPSRENDIVWDAIEISRNIAKEVNEPTASVENHILSKFNTLVHLLKTASVIQLNNITDRIFEDLKPNSTALGHTTWLTVMDAIVHAGTAPSLLCLHTWLRQGLVTGEQAAQLISTVTNTVEYPTEDYMQTFFELVKTTESFDHTYINSSSVLAFSSLIKKVYVCDKSMFKRFPVYVFGRSVQRHSNAIDFTYLPYLANKLKHAINDGDSHKIQIYIRAIGNTAHPKIVQIFQPYINGEEKVTKFQRLLMISCLDSLAIVNPNLASNVLFKVYMNQGEVPEIRVQAVALLLRTNPSAQTLQRMAEATNWDSSDQVNAAVKSAIISISQMQNVDTSSLKALDATNFLTDSIYGLSYSTNHIQSFMNQQNLGYKLRWNHIQGSGSIIPNSFFFTLRPILGEFTQRAYKYSWMTSGTDNLISLINDQFHSKGNRLVHERNNTKSQFRIEEVLNMTPLKREQVEGNLYFTLHGARRFIAFDNHTVEEIPKLIKFASSAFRIGETFNYTKLYNQFSLRLAFPTEMGLPFVYTIEVPTMISIMGEARINSNPDLANGSPDKTELPRSLNITSDFRATFSTKTEAKLGFVTPFNHHYYLTGYDSNIYLHLPLKTRLDFDIEKSRIWTKFQPLHPDKYQKIFELSSMAYTTKHNIFNLSPPQLDKNLKFIYTRPTKQFSTTKGHHTTGFGFDIKGLNGQSPDQVLRLFKALEQNDLTSALMFFDKSSTIDSLSKINIYYNPEKTTSKSAKFVINYADVKRFAESEEEDNPSNNQAITNVGDTEHKKRMELLLKKSSSGMRDYYAQAIDLAAEFEGGSTGWLVLTAAYARSYVSEKARSLFFFSKEPSFKTLNSKPFQVAMDVRSKLPNVPLGNFKEAIQSDPTSDFVARINFGEKVTLGAELMIKGQIKKSPERVNYLLNLPLAHQCEKQMNQSNYLLQACHNLTTRANFVDHYYLRVDYQNVSDYWRELSYKGYSLARYYSQPYMTENVDQSSNNGRIEFDAVFSPELNSFNASLQTPTFSTQLSNVRVNKYFHPALISHPHYSVAERIYEKIMFSQNAPRCVIDDNSAVTFDNKTFSLYIGQCWHVLLHFSSGSQWTNKSDGNNNTLTGGNVTSLSKDNVDILIRGTEGQHRQIIIILGNNTIRFHSTPEGPSNYFTVNEEKVDVNDDVVGHYEDASGSTLVQVYRLPVGAMRINAPQHGLKLLYDGLRVEILASSRYRNKVRGLCGTFDGEKATDFTTPKNCILKHYLHFVSTYALLDETCKGPTRDFHRLAQEAPCFEQVNRFAPIIKSLSRIELTQNYSTNLQIKKAI